MAKQINNWAVQVGDTTHHVELKKNKIFIDNCDGKKLNEFTTTKERGFQRVEIPLDSEVVYLYVSTFGGYALVQNGIDLATNEQYDATPLPKWVWLFWILFIVDFAAVCGGAIGGALNFLGAATATKIVAKREKSTGKRVIFAVLVWLGFTIVEAIIAVAVSGI